MGGAAPRPSTRTMVLCTGTRGSLVRCPLRQRRPVRAARAAARSLPDSGRDSRRELARIYDDGAGRQLRTQQRASDGFICVTSRDPACRVKQAQPKPETHGRTRSTLMALLTARNSGCVVCRVTYLPFAFSSDASCAHLPLPLLGAPVSIGALVKLGSRSLAKQDRD